MSVNETLLELQGLDTALDQLRYRLDHLPELEAAKQARADLLAWERTRGSMRDRIAELDRTIEAAESKNAEIDTHRTRLESQLRTVIAPREAEAIQSELRTLATRREGIDETELAALEEQSDLDDRLSAHVALEGDLRGAVEVTDAGLATVQLDIETERIDLERRRGEVRAAIAAPLLARYDSLRAHHGVAVVRFTGKRCDGCHLDLSPAEVDVVKHVADGDLADCPQCGRLLVR